MAVEQGGGGRTGLLLLRTGWLASSRAQPATPSYPLEFQLPLVRINSKKSPYRYPFHEKTQASMASAPRWLLRCVVAAAASASAAAAAPAATASNDATCFVGGATIWDIDMASAAPSGAALRPHALSRAAAADEACTATIAAAEEGGGGAVPILSAVERAKAEAQKLKGAVEAAAEPSAASSGTVAADAHITTGVFVVANGANEGHWLQLSFDPTIDAGADADADAGQCALARLAAAAADLVAPDRSPRRALFLYGVSGLPVRRLEEVYTKASNVLQLLVEGEAWVWGGAEVGFTWHVGDGVLLQTASLGQRVLIIAIAIPPTPSPSPLHHLRHPATTIQLHYPPPWPPPHQPVNPSEPRVFLVRNVLTNEDIAEVIESGRKQMRRSPEKHYAPVSSCM